MKDGWNSRSFQVLLVLHSASDLIWSLCLTSLLIKLVQCACAQATNVIQQHNYGHHLWKKSNVLQMFCCRSIYPGGHGEYSRLSGCGLLRLHSTYRHDLKIYASDEGRVQMTAAAFAKVSKRWDERDAYSCTLGILYTLLIIRGAILNF